MKTSRMTVYLTFNIKKSMTAWTCTSKWNNTQGCGCYEIIRCSHPRVRNTTDSYTDTVFALYTTVLYSLYTVHITVQDYDIEVLQSMTSPYELTKNVFDFVKNIWNQNLNIYSFCRVLPHFLLF